MSADGEAEPLHPGVPGEPPDGAPGLRAELVPPGGYPVVPGEPPDGGAWLRGEQFRVLPNGLGQVDLGADRWERVVDVHLEGRAKRWAGLRFTVTLAQTSEERLELVAVAVRPLAYDDEVTAGGKGRVPKVSDRLPSGISRLSATRLDEVPWGQLEEVARREFGRSLGWIPELGAWLDDAPRRRGRPRVPVRRLLEVAEAYVEAFEGGSLTPTKLVADQLGLTASQVNKLLDKAVARGLFRRTGGAAKAGGELTEEGRRVADSMARSWHTRTESGRVAE